MQLVKNYFSVCYGPMGPMKLSPIGHCVIEEHPLGISHKNQGGGHAPSFLGDGDGQGGLACWDSWGRKELDMTEQLN